MSDKDLHTRLSPNLFAMPTSDFPDTLMSSPVSAYTHIRCLVSLPAPPPVSSCTMVLLASRLPMVCYPRRHSHGSGTYITPQAFLTLLSIPPPRKASRELAEKAQVGDDVPQAAWTSIFYTNLWFILESPAHCTKTISEQQRCHERSDACLGEVSASSQKLSNMLLRKPVCSYQLS